MIDMQLEEEIVDLVEKFRERGMKEDDILTALECALERYREIFAEEKENGNE